MQADRFTIKAQEAIAAAGQLAERRHNPQVTPEHLLSVLLEQVLWGHLWVVAALGELAGRRDGLLGLDGESISLHKELSLIHI